MAPAYGVHTLYSTPGLMENGPPEGFAGWTTVRTPSRTCLAERRPNIRNYGFFGRKMGARPYWTRRHPPLPCIS
jgi:hypothetical protein